MGARTGVSGAGAIAYFVVITSLLLIGFTALLYPIALLIGGTPLKCFAWSVAPAQVVAAGTRSSLASLPALIEGGERRLGLAAAIAGFVLPLSTSTFKVNRTISSTTKFLFLAKLYGIELDAFQVASLVGVVMLLSSAVREYRAGGIW
jgi:proton glutamate symport protein